MSMILIFWKFELELWINWDEKCWSQNESQCRCQYKYKLNTLENISKSNIYSMIQWHVICISWRNQEHGREPVDPVEPVELIQLMSLIIFLRKINKPKTISHSFPTQRESEMDGREGEREREIEKYLYQQRNYTVQENGSVKQIRKNHVNIWTV